MARDKPKAASPPRRRQKGAGGVTWNSQKDRYQAVLDMGRDADGERVRKTYAARLKGKTPEAYDECTTWLEQAKADYLAGKLLAPTRDTVEGFLRQWSQEQ